MREDIKEIMRNSFDKSFYVDKSNKEINYEYLNTLTDYILDRDNGCLDYEKIANKICIYDERIKNAFNPDLGIIVCCLDSLELGDLACNSFTKSLDFYIIKRIFRYSKDLDEIRSRIATANIFYNWENLNNSRKEGLIDAVIRHLNNSWQVDIKMNDHYRVRKISDDWFVSIAVNKLIAWISERTEIIFSHQSTVSLELLEECEKDEMYYQIENELSSRPYEKMSCSVNQFVFDHVLKPFHPIYECDENDYIYSDMSEFERGVFDSFLYYRDIACGMIYSSIKDKIDLQRELLKKANIIDRMLVEIEGFQKVNASIQRENEHLICENDRLNEKLGGERKVLESELYSLREYMFRSQERNANSDYSPNIVKHYAGDYRSVAVIGGHSKWHEKLSRELNGISIINTDQNVVDWNFLKKIRVVVVVTNYISHSMYYRLMEKIEDQKLLYLDYKNIEHLKCEIDEMLTSN